MHTTIKKYFSKELSSHEQLEVLRRTRVDDSFRKEFIHYHNLHAIIQITSKPTDSEEGKLKFTKFLSITRRLQIHQLTFKIFRYAAIVAIIVTGTWHGNSFYHKQQLSDKQNKLFVPAGQRACLTLNDGTEVWLNASSTLVYPAEFRGEERLVSLSGEAYFDVASDPEKPFIVSINTFYVKALGTEFNIHGYTGSDYTCISLLEGSAHVYQPGNPGKDIILKPFEQVFIQNDEMRIEPVDNMADFLWKDGIYNFNDEPFENIIKKLEQYYCVKIVVKDPAILDFEYTGKFFQLDGIDEILRIIQKIQLFKIEKDMESNIIYISK